MLADTFAAVCVGARGRVLAHHGATSHTAADDLARLLRARHIDDARAVAVYAVRGDLVRGLPEAPRVDILGRWTRVPTRGAYCAHTGFWNAEGRSR